MAKSLAQHPLMPEVPGGLLSHPRVCGLNEDRARVETFLQALVGKGLSTTWNPVPQAIEYSVMGRAQRYRPVLALRVARTLDCETEHVLRAGAAVELLHSASLIIDDLPCMDDEAMRRGKPAVHIQFGEPTAILSAFSMVALAARIVTEASATESECIRLRRFQLALLRTLDCSSLVGGQSMDLTLVGAERDQHRSAVNELKTVPLFQLAVEAGCVSHPGGMPAELESFGRAFGVAFQLTDDLLDGELHDRKILDETYEQCRACLRPYGTDANPLHELVDSLASRSQI